IVATAGKDGQPNGVPVALGKIISDDEIIVVDTLMYKTRRNLEENQMVAVTYWSSEDHYGYQLKGQARVETWGKLFDDTVTWVKTRFPHANPKAVITVRVEEVYYIGRGKDSSKNLVE
ncbi:MAG: pyridoxamine 5'-phosphate oxidase family protein, partial [Chloroflexota bacterium]